MLPPSSLLLTKKSVVAARKLTDQGKKGVKTNGEKRSHVETSSPQRRVVRFRSVCEEFEDESSRSSTPEVPGLERDELPNGSDIFQMILKDMASESNGDETDDVTNDRPADNVSEVPDITTKKDKKPSSKIRSNSNKSILKRKLSSKCYR